MIAVLALPPILHLGRIDDLVHSRLLLLIRIVAPRIRDGVARDAWAAALRTGLWVVVVW